MGPPDGRTQFFAVKVAGICPQAVMLHSAVYRVCPEVQRGLQRFPVSRRAQQLRHLHHWIPLLWSYCSQEFR